MFLVGLALVDIPVVVAVAVFSHDDPVGAAKAFLEWRQSHPWTLLLSVPAVCWLAFRAARRFR